LTIVSHPNDASSLPTRIVTLPNDTDCFVLTTVSLPTKPKPRKTASFAMFS